MILLNSLDQFVGEIMIKKSKGDDINSEPLAFVFEELSERGNKIIRIVMMRFTQKGERREIFNLFAGAIEIDPEDDRSVLLDIKYPKEKIRFERAI
jgi:hypothetical protein